jgi:hypothetical protein
MLKKRIREFCKKQWGHSAKMKRRFFFLDFGSYFTLIIYLPTGSYQPPNYDQNMLS